VKTETLGYEQLKTYFCDCDRFTSVTEHLYSIETHIISIAPRCQNVDDKVLPSRQLRNYKFVSVTQNVLSLPQLVKWKM